MESSNDSKIGGSVLKLELDPSKAGGRIKRLNGTNLAAPTSMQEMPCMDVSEDLRALEIPLTRLHDAPWESNGLRLVDIPNVFPLFHADPSDPKNYFFEATDDYIANCLNYGSKVLYRLGVTIEHSKRKYFAKKPSDFAKWTEICAGVIRHFNEGWANGFHWNIEYWEIWNEPDLGSKMWDGGTWEDYVELYITASKRLKELFPNIKIGGPALTFLNSERIRLFLAECKRRNAPLDFFSWHCYNGSLPFMIEQPKTARALLDEAGFQATKLNLNEWHYMPGDWKRMGSDREYLAELCKETTGPDGAAFAAATLSGWQDGPMDFANCYTGSLSMCGGLWGLFSGAFRRNKCYFAFDAFNRVAKCVKRVPVEMESVPGVQALAGAKEDGGVSALVSVFKAGGGELELKFKGMDLERSRCSVLAVDAARDLEPFAEFSVSGDTLRLKTPEGSSILLVEVGRKEDGK